MDKYIIVRASSSEELEQKVLKKIEIGYEPIGGVAILSASHSSYYQAMILQEIVTDYSEKDE